MIRMVHTHLHTSGSNSILADSPSSIDDYIKKAKETGISFIVTNHGNNIGWYNNKIKMEKAGLKYIHAFEGYVCESLEDKKSYHVGVYAMNNNGRLEINDLITKSYVKDGHFYRRPRFSIDELLACENVLITTACIGGVMNSDVIMDKLVIWKHAKERLFLEIQPHNDESQIEMNFRVFRLADEYGLKIISANDVHYANKDDDSIRKSMQLSKGMKFDYENEWKLHYKTVEEMEKEYRDCDEAYMEVGYILNEAINNTVLLYDMCEEYEIDTSFKYPHLYKNPTKEISERCIKRFKELGYYGKKEYVDRLVEELETYKVLGAESYMLLFSDWIKGCKDNSINVGFSRGSASGSIVSYLLGITEIDPIMWGTSFSRFMNKDRISLADIDIDLPPNRREEASQWFYTVNGLNCSKILTLGTEQMKGSVDMVMRASGLSMDERRPIADKLKSTFESFHNSMVGKGLAKALGSSMHLIDDLDGLLEKYECMEYKKYAEKVLGVSGTITKIGSHPAGVLVSDLDIDREVGIIRIADERVSQLNMKELEAIGYVKADALGLANIGVINRTCNYVGIERPSPQTINVNDDKVWENIKQSPVGIFQFENEIAHSRLVSSLNHIHDAERITTMSLASGIIRPSGDSIRDKYINGIKYDNGHDVINEFFKDNNSYIVYQEDIIAFLQEFCGYSGSEADNVRRAIAKKGDTHALVEEIKSRFISYFSKKYNETEERCAELIIGFLKIVDDASSYGFSLNHSISYSITGYLCGYLRTYYPKEFLTANLNEFKDKPDKMKKIIRYIEEMTNIKIVRPKFGKASMEYTYSNNDDIIYEGLFGAKGLSKNAESELEKLRGVELDDFLQVIFYIKENDIKLKVSDMIILTKLDFFSEFGKQNKLEQIIKMAMDSKSKVRYNPKAIKTQKTIDKKKSVLDELWNTLPNIDKTDIEKAKNEVEIIGHVYTKVDFDALYVYDIVKPYSTYFVDCICLKTGEQKQYKVAKSNIGELKKSDVITNIEVSHKYKKQKVVIDEKSKWVDTDILQEYLDSFAIVKF